MPQAQNLMGTVTGLAKDPRFYIPAAAAVSGITAGLARQNENAGYELKAQQYETQKQTAALNERLASLAIANAYDSGAYQAMVQGLSDAQTIAQTRASRAGSGVRLGVGSAREIEASQRVNAALNQAQIQKSTLAAATNSMLDQYNYKIQQVIAQGNANAARAFQRGSGLDTLTSFITSAGMFDQIYQSGGKNKSALAGLFSALF